MKKRILLVGLALSIFGLSGCDKPINLSEKEEDMVAEYIAGAVLNSQDGYKEKLISPTPIPTATPVPTKTVETSDIQEKEDDNKSVASSTDYNSQANADLTEVIGVKKVTAEYKNWQIIKAFEESGFNLQPQKGNVFIGIKFTLKNTSDHVIKVDLSNKAVRYMLHINQSKKVYPSLTMLENDLQTASCEIKAGEEKEMALIYEVSGKLKIDQLNLIAYTDDKTAIIKVK